jgi:tetratricopeptide (TPR) repeat protein
MLSLVLSVHSWNRIGGQPVFERDYLLRLLSQASLVLGKAMGLRQQQKQKEALDLIDEFLGRELRLRSRLAMGLSDEDLLSMLSVTGTPNAESVAVVAALLQEEADLLADLGQTDESVPRYAKALRLNLYILRKELEFQGWDVRKRVSDLLSALSRYELGVDTKIALWQWYESDGRFAEAEDLLYELQEEEGVSIDEGIAFYERISANDDSALELGGLPRNEMEEGRRPWSA